MLHISVRYNIWRYNISVKLLALPRLSRVIAIRYLAVDVFEVFLNASKPSARTYHIIAIVDIVVFLRPDIPLVKGPLE
jgi:hypothetical protein